MGGGTPADAGRAEAAGSAQAAGRFDRFILGPRADAFFFGPGATLVVGGVLLLLPLLGAGAGGVATKLTAALSLLLIGPHYGATYRRAYTSREVIRAHPWVTLAVPLILLGAAVAAVADPTRIGLVYFGLYVGWSGYHYSKQSLGIAMLYPLRQGARLDVREKRLISAPLFVSWLLSLLGLFRLSGSARNPAYELVRTAYHGPSLPGWALAVGLAALAASGLGVLSVARARRARGVPLPWPTYAVLLAQVVWFTSALYSPIINITMVPMFHGLQYLALTSWHATREPTAGTRGHFVVYAVTVLVLGFLITPVLFALMTGPDANRTLMATAALITFVNLHHFLLDGRIWRLRERRVAQSMIA
ncbi:MAG TPA: hypothetical protein VKZ18_29130 [Polyangia bacterium]|nr:hypothetical protein [Polyangia bacterium]